MAVATMAEAQYKDTYLRACTDILYSMESASTSVFMSCTLRCTNTMNLIIYGGMECIWEQQRNQKPRQVVAVSDYLNIYANY